MKIRAITRPPTARRKPTQRPWSACLHPETLAAGGLISTAASRAGSQPESVPHPNGNRQTGSNPQATGWEQGEPLDPGSWRRPGDGESKAIWRAIKGSTSGRPGGSQQGESMGAGSAARTRARPLPTAHRASPGAGPAGQPASSWRRASSAQTQEPAPGPSFEQHQIGALLRRWLLQLNRAGLLASG